MVGESPQCTWNLNQPLAGPISPAFTLQEIPAELVAPIFLLLHPDTTEGSRIPPRRQQNPRGFLHVNDPRACTQMIPALRSLFLKV